MKTIHYARTLAGLACVAVLPLTASAQDDFDPAKMEEVMKKYGTPGKQHKALRNWTGLWKAESSYWMAPGAPPMKTMGESKVRMLMQGRYMTEQYSSEIPGMGPFMGVGTLAYDRVAKEYIHTWIDNTGTGIMISRGKESDDGKKVEMKATFKDPMVMKDVTFRMVLEFGDGKTRKMTMYATYPGKPEHKHMEIAYTKVSDLKGKKEGAKTGAAAGALLGGAAGEAAEKKK